MGCVLRASLGNAEVVLYDPHDLLGSLGLVHAARLEDATRGKGKATGDEWTIPELEGVGETAVIPPAVAVDQLSAWATDVLGALRGAGLAEPPACGEGSWRQRQASSRQRELLQKLMWAKRYLPDPRHRKALEWLASRESLRSGTASDLIAVLGCLASQSAPDRQARRHWHLPLSLPAPLGVAA